LLIGEGIVVWATSKKVLLDLGKESLIKKGMRCIFFKDGKPIVHPKTGKGFGIPAVKLAYALTIAVNEGYSEANIIKDLCMGIEPEHRVITQ
jgi:hypothetical protein